MAEILGAIASGLTLVGLFKVCVEAFDVIQHARRQDLDYRKLALRLNIEKCRLYTWGEAMCLTDIPRGDGARPLEGHKFEALIRETLEMIVMLFNDSEKLKNVYGCRNDIEQSNLPDAIESDSVDKLGAAFKNFRIRSSATDPSPVLLKKAKWAIHDRKKFAMLISETQNLIDGLQEITKSLVSVPQQAGQMTRSIKKIKDVGTHKMLADVCEDDYPELSEASSKATETASMLPENVNVIQQWTNEVEEADHGDQDLEEVESLTFAELKQRYLLLKQQSRETSGPAEELGLLSLSDSGLADPGWSRAPRILLVDDDPLCRRTCGKFLDSFGCVFDTAFDGLEAVSMVQESEKYDLILMDIIMPNLDGVSASRVIRQFDRALIVAITSNIRSDDIELYFQHGIDDVLAKPFTRQSLRDMLEKHIHLEKEPVVMDDPASQQEWVIPLQPGILIQGS